MADTAIIRLTFNARQLEFFKTRLPKVLGYSAQEGINNTMKKWVQPALFERSRDEFQIRNPKLFFGTDARPGGVAGRITHFASVKDNTPFSEIEGGTLTTKLPAADRNRRLLFSYFETGGTRTPFTPGAKSVAEPVVGAARPSWPDKVLNQFKFSQLQLRPYYKPPKQKRQKGVRRGKQRRLIQPRGMAGNADAVSMLANGQKLLGYYGRVLPSRAIPERAKGVQRKGRYGTFVKFTPALPHGGVYQRSPDDPKAAPRLLWAFDPPSALKSGLGWVRTAREQAQRHFSAEVDAKIKERMDHELAAAARVH